MHIDYCFHTHTSRCGHATGADEEYVLKAIENGIKVMGFSDHVMVPGQHLPHIKGDYYELDGYIDSVLSLREKYKGKIEILLAFECEYSPLLHDYYKSLLEEKGFDYLILGQHFHVNEDMSASFYFHRPLGIERYVDDLIEGINSGLFKYVAHPDLFVVDHPEWDETDEKAARRILVAAKKAGIPIEINVNGRYRVLRSDERHYPDEGFWEKAAEYDIPVYIGYDAHAPEHFDRPDDEQLEIVRKYGLRLLTR